MAFKNSAGIKFNKDTELIIRADQDGTVESCYNLANNTEYVGSATPVTFADVTLTNTTASSKSMTYVQAAGTSYATSKTESIAANATTTFHTIVNGIITAPSGATLTVVSGNFDNYDARHAVPLDAAGGELSIS